MKKLIVLIILALSINACGLIVPHIIPFSDLPLPTGPFNVGTQIFEWEDTSREEWFTEESDDFRRLVIQVWYPTLVEKKGDFSYLDYSEKRTGPLSKVIELPEFIIHHIKDVKANSILNAHINVGQELYPLILFSHGLGGMRMQNTVQMEELASKGYVVIAMDHPYDANVTIFRDGSVAGFRSGLRDDASEEEFWKIRLPQINTRAADISFIIDQITNRKDDILWKFIDITKVGVFGHSFGGSTAIVASFTDSRISACLNLDGWLVVVPDHIISEGIVQDFMYIGQDKWWDELNYKKLDQFIESNQSSSKILIPGTTHYDFSDMPHLSSAGKILGKTGKGINMNDFKNALNELIISFFNKSLKNSQSGINYYDFATKYEISMTVEQFEGTSDK